LTSFGAYALAGCTNLETVFFRGNAPDNGSAFIFCPKAIGYFLPETSGWGTTSGGIPLAPWLPRISCDSAPIGQKPFGFRIDWASGQMVVVEASSNVSAPNWQALQTNTLMTDSADFSDSQWTNYPSRFYRLRAP
jgi:hypothetical protein